MSKITVDLTHKPKDLDGTELTQEPTLGQILATYLSRTNEGDSVRLMSFARELWENKPLEIGKDLADSVVRILDSPTCELRNIYNDGIKRAFIEANLNDQKGGQGS